MSASTVKHALNIEVVHKHFGHTEVLKGISLDLEEGGFLVLLGPSGCGKSTLLNIIAGLESVSAGTIRIGGRVANDMYPKDRDIAMVFQSYALYPSMTVERNMGFGLEMRGVGKLARASQVEKAAELLNIKALLQRKPSQLSGGQRQRVAMGRAIVREPELFLFDEPLSNLDAKLRTRMRSEIKKLHRRLGASIVYVTHDQVEAMTLASMVAIMHEGSIQQIGTPSDIYNDPQNLFVAGFVGSPPMNFLHGRTRLQDATIELDDNAGLAPLPPEINELTDGQQVVLGLRPESLSTTTGTTVGMSDSVWSFDVTVEVTEPMGADTLVHFMLGADELTARLGGKEQPEAGDTLRLGIALSELYLFDRASERRLQ